jgi:hypothetical protein
MNNRIYPTASFKNAIKELRMKQIRLSRILKIAKIWTW